jgi:hypothetical protein
MLMTKNRYFALLAIMMVINVIQSCAPPRFRNNYRSTNQLFHETKNLKKIPFLKAHMKNGSVCILTDTWTIDNISNTVKGKGARYDFNRNKVFEGEIIIPVDSVTIFETNKKLREQETNRITGLSVMLALDAVLGVVAITTGVLWGSCPTFYTNDNLKTDRADAEGFSNAIYPSREYADIDAIKLQSPPADTFSITMKNEALETHCVNEVKLLACQKKKGQQVFQSPYNDFYLCENLYKLSGARADEGDITALLNEQDMKERFSLSDKNNLSSKEAIYFNFENVDQTSDLGLILDFRQTLMTTYFIYSAIAYMGDEVGDIFAKIENDKGTKAKINGGIWKELGNIDVYLWNEKKGNWEFQNGFFETGPIAINKQIIKLSNPTNSEKVKLKIVLNKGLWRLDYVALTNVKEKITPLEIMPEKILNKGKQDNEALLAMKDPEKYIISMPGSEYKFNFRLPDKKADYELFLSSKGYYFEWMREDWLKKKNLLRLRQMLEKPKRYLKTESKRFKRYEAEIERLFWKTKVDTKNFSYNEN